MKWTPFAAGVALLLAGCATPTEPVSDEHQVTGDVEGVELRLALLTGPTETKVGKQAQWTFALQNVDTRSVELARGCGHEWSGPWIEDDAGQRVQHAEPTGSCDGFGHESLAPGEEWTTSLRWDGSVYDTETGERSGTAKSDTYHIVVAAPWDEAGGYYLELEVPIQAA